MLDRSSGFCECGSFFLDCARLGSLYFFPSKSIILRLSCCNPIDLSQLFPRKNNKALSSKKAQDVSLPLSLCISLTLGHSFSFISSLLTYQIAFTLARLSASVASMEASIASRDIKLKNRAAAKNHSGRGCFPEKRRSWSEFWFPWWKIKLFYSGWGRFGKLGWRWAGVAGLGLTWAAGSKTYYIG